VVPPSARARAANEDREAFLLEKDERAAALAEAWRDLYLYLREQFEALPDQDIVRVFRELADAGEIEPMASAATHGFLPLLPNDRAIERQLDVGLAAFERHWGRPAHGIWIPECAYRPPGLWVSPADGHAEIRPGLEDFLAARGVRFFFVETHLVAGGLTPAAYGGNVFRDYEGQSPYRTHAVRAMDGTPVGVFARDPLSSQQVWSGKVGYPGDPAYLEFHRKRAAGTATGASPTRARPGVQKLYEPEKVHAVVSQHAAHFISMLRQVELLSDGTPGLVVGCSTSSSSGTGGSRAVVPG
jgi:1,4-alpha-glucan branching enzyme